MYSTALISNRLKTVHRRRRRRRRRRRVRGLGVGPLVQLMVVREVVMLMVMMVVARRVFRRRRVRVQEVGRAHGRTVVAGPGVHGATVLIPAKIARRPGRGRRRRRRYRVRGRRVARVGVVLNGLLLVRELVPGASLGFALAPLLAQHVRTRDSLSPPLFLASAPDRLLVHR